MKQAFKSRTNSIEKLEQNNTRNYKSSIYSRHRGDLPIEFYDAQKVPVVTTEKSGEICSTMSSHYLVNPTSATRKMISDPCIYRTNGQANNLQSIKTQYKLETVVLDSDASQCLILPKMKKNRNKKGSKFVYENLGSVDESVKMNNAVSLQ